MRIYLADCKRRAELYYNKLFEGLNHLESYFKIITAKVNIKKWSIYENLHGNLAAGNKPERKS